MNKEEDSSIYFIKNKFYERIRRMNNDILFKNKIEDSKSTQDEITNDCTKDKTEFYKLYFIKNKKKLYNKNISHFEISNLFKAIDKSYIHLDNKNNKSQILCRSKSQNYYFDSSLKDKNNKEKKIKFVPKKYENCENLFSYNLNEQLYNFSQQFFYKYKHF